jgi:hypothetical protein
MFTILEARRIFFRTGISFKTLDHVVNNRSACPFILQAVGTKQKAEYMWQGLIKTKRSGM